MKLLICTQALDAGDSNLGFFHQWVAEFAKHCEKVTVICLREGEHQLPDNVFVYSLGKEKGAVSKIQYAFRFWKLIKAHRREYDAVFVHMNPEYIVLGGYLWRRWHTPVSLWYAHKSVTAKLRFAMRFVTYVFTVAPDSFAISSKKVCAVGHGIDTELFKPGMREGSIETRIVTTGRVAGSKHLLEMLLVCDVLYARHEKFSFTMVGEPVTAVEQKYARALAQEIEKRAFVEKIHMTGALPHGELPALLNAQDVFLNFATTGNMDKAGLEALAMGVPVVATNEAFRALLEPFGLFVPQPTAERLADAIDHIMNRPDRASVVATLRNKVVAEHSLARLVPKILALL